MLENSATALGPALFCGLNLVQEREGSQIILCTDGLANIGLGSLDGCAEDLEQSKEFYRQIGL